MWACSDPSLCAPPLPLLLMLLLDQIECSLA
jgi:hypothetical protein